MSAHKTLFEFLEDSGAGVRSYDLGRRISEVPRAAFLDFERGELPYPLPMQRQAWFALVQLPEVTPDVPVIWFLRLDLDEQGLLVLAERDYLLSRLLESAQARVQGADPQVFLQDNPYAFTPRDDRMAVFHALLSRDLGLPPSRFYRHALDYFSGIPGWDQWEFVGYQGIADVASRHVSSPLDSAIAHLPNEPLVALCHCLESTRPAASLIQALIDRLTAALADEAPDTATVAALIRGLSPAADEPRVQAALREILDHPAVGGDIEILAAISGRAWEALHDETLLSRYLNLLAGSEHGQSVFEHCLSDLLSLPALAGEVRKALRSPHQSVEVRTAFGRMATGQRKAPDAG